MHTYSLPHVAAPTLTPQPHPSLLPALPLQEWFFPWGEGSVRMYAGQKSIKYLPGQVPGFNAPITVPGSASIKKGDILYSPVGVVHWFSAEDKGVYNFIQVHAYGEPCTLEFHNLVSGRGSGAQGRRPWPHTPS